MPDLATIVAQVKVVNRDSERRRIELSRRQAS
jgi:ribosomal protein S1